MVKNKSILLRYAVMQVSSVFCESVAIILIILLGYLCRMRIL